MFLIKSLLASSVLFQAASAFAVTPALHTVTSVQADAQADALPWYSSVCVANIGIDKGIAAQYRYGDDGEWKDQNFDVNTETMFTVIYRDSMEPLKLTVKFKNKEGADAEEKSYDLSQTQTMFRPHNCSRLENYKFEKTDAPELTVDLVHVGQ